MLMFIGIMLLFLAVVVFLITALAEGMSDRPVSKSEFWSQQWPAVLLALTAVLIFVARHYLHGKSITW